MPQWASPGGMIIWWAIKHSHSFQVETLLPLEIWTVSTGWMCIVEIMCKCSYFPQKTGPSGVAQSPSRVCENEVTSPHLCLVAWIGGNDLGNSQAVQTMSGCSTSTNKSWLHNDDCGPLCGNSVVVDWHSKWLEAFLVSNYNLINYNWEAKILVLSIRVTWLCCDW